MIEMIEKIQLLQNDFNNKALEVANQLDDDEAAFAIYEYVEQIKYWQREIQKEHNLTATSENKLTTWE